MARTIPSTFVPIDATETGTTRPIDDTEQTIARNIHYLYANYSPEVVNTTFRSNKGGVSASPPLPYVVGTNPLEINAQWCVPTPGSEFSHWKVSVLAENTSSSSSGTVRFDLGSDPHPGTFTDLTVAAGAAQWTTVTGSLAIDHTQSMETIRMLAGAQIRVHAVMICGQALTSIAGAPNSAGGYVFVPIDDGETSQDAPLSTRLRRREYENLVHIYKNRPGAIIGWSEDYDFRPSAQAFHTTSSDFVEVIRIPFLAPKGAQFAQWALFAEQDQTGFVSTGKIRLTTSEMESKGISPITVDAPATFSTPYTNNLITWDSAGGLYLHVKSDTDQPATQNELIVSLKSDGASTVTLLGLTAWFFGIV